MSNSRNIADSAPVINFLDGVTSNVQTQLNAKGTVSNLADLSITSTSTEINKLDAISRGSLIYGNPSAETAILTKGTANQVLTSDGTDISWADAGGGAYTFISSIDMNGASTVDFTNLPTTTYDDFFIVIGGLKLTGVYDYFRARMFINNTIVSGSNYYSGRHFNSSTSSNSYNATFTSRIELWNNTTVNEIMSARIWLNHMNDASNTRLFNGFAEVNSADQQGGSATALKMQRTNFYCDADGSTNAYDGIRFYPSASTFVGGTARLYGLAKS